MDFPLVIQLQETTPHDGICSLPIPNRVIQICHRNSSICPKIPTDNGCQSRIHVPISPFFLFLAEAVRFVVFPCLSRQTRKNYEPNYFFERGYTYAAMRIHCLIGDNAVTSSKRIAQVFPELVGRKTCAIWKVYGGRLKYVLIMPCI